MQFPNSFKNIGIFLLMGICCGPNFVNGRTRPILLPDENVLANPSTDFAVEQTVQKVSDLSWPIEEDSEDNFCFTPEGHLGECVLLDQCPQLAKLYKVNAQQTRPNNEYLKNRICRLYNKTNQVCCGLDQIVSTTPATSPNNISINASLAECGFSTITRITNGTEQYHGAHPWLVGIGSPVGKEGFDLKCGGTLISKRHVLTASHCFLREQRNTIIPTHVKLGDYSLSKNNELEPPVTLAISSRKSPGYNAISLLNDIELLTLERDVEFTPFITPACLPFDLGSKNFSNVQATIVGWGKTSFNKPNNNDVPLVANIAITTKSSCKESYRRFTAVPLDKTQVCAGSEGKDTCQGDSGGPLLYKNPDERAFVIGVASAGVVCGDENYPGIYTFVPEFTQWIMDNL